MTVSGSIVTVGTDEACLVHTGDILTVKRLYCDPRPGQKAIKDCEAYQSGSIRVSQVDPSDHTAKGQIVQGTVSVDSPVFMTDPANYPPFSMP